MAAPSRREALNRLDPQAAWQPWQPNAGQPWNPKWIAHLYRRAAFCPSWDEIALSLHTGLEATLDRLLRGGRVWKSSMSWSRNRPAGWPAIPATPR